MNDIQPTEQPTVPAEPDDHSIVAWFNGDGIPCRVFVRVDEYARLAEEDHEDRWFEADERSDGAALAEAMAGAAEDYRQCIAAARASSDPGYYEKCNGRAEAYRQAATRLAELTGVPAPDWDQIRREVPADGVYRDGAS